MWPYATHAHPCIRLIAIIFLVKFATDARLMSPDPTCLGQVAMFRCSNVDDTGVDAAIWRFDNASTDQCLVNLAPYASVTCGPDGKFTATVESATGNSYISTLTVTAAVDLNGTLVQCVGTATFSANLQVISE